MTEAKLTALEQIERAFGKGSIAPHLHDEYDEPVERAEGRPWWQVGWKYAQWRRNADRYDPRLKRKDKPMPRKSWASWAIERRFNRITPGCPF